MICSDIWRRGNRSFRQRVVSPTVSSQTPWVDSQTSDSRHSRAYGKAGIRNPEREPETEPESGILNRVKTSSRYIIQHGVSSFISI